MVDVSRGVKKIDRFQQRHRLTAFSYGVIKKFSDDQMGYQAALLTYYTFLALFPLLLVLSTLTQLVASDNPHLQNSIVSGVTNYFPVLGGQLAAHVHSLHRNGIALGVGLLFIIYGTRGVADVFRRTLNDIWQVPLKEREGFPASMFKSFTLIFVGSLGFIVASISSGLFASAGHELPFKLLSLLIELVILFWLFAGLLKISLARRPTPSEVHNFALAVALGLVIMQALGSYILVRQLKNLDALYSYFALALGLMFWIYLQAQVIYYAAELTIVKSRKLWPRKLVGK